MQLDPLKTQSSVDAKTAQEALALAIRLQQEKGERVSIEELQRTADEAGIDRVYLESALHQVAQKAEVVPELPISRRPYCAIAMGAMISMSVVVLMSRTSGDSHSHIYLLALCFMAIVARRAMRSSGPGTPRRRFRNWPW